MSDGADNPAITTREPGRQPDPREAAEVWPVRLVVGGVAGWSLWHSADTDLLLARAGRVQLFGSPEAMLEALGGPEAGFTPPAVVDLGAEMLRRIAASPATTFDLDAAAAWFADEDRAATIVDCDRALDAINMATDIGATAGDDRLAALVESDALLPAFDALTFGLTFLGDGSPYRNDPDAMVGAITPEAARAAVELFALAAAHVEAR